ncbi:hypothetical protein D3C80_1296000 [compost metagenome]
MKHSGVGADEAQRLQGGGGGLIGPSAEVSLAGRLVHGQEDEHGQDQARHAGDEEGGPPAVVGGDDAAEQETGGRAEGRAGPEDPHGGRSTLLGKQVGDHRHGRRRGRRLRGADRQARHDERRIALGKTADRGADAPDRHDGGQEFCPVDPVDQPSHGQAGQGVGQAESQSCQHAELAVGELELGLDRFDQDRHHRTVDGVRHIDQRQDDERIPGALGERRGLGVRHGQTPTWRAECDVAQRLKMTGTSFLRAPVTASLSAKLDQRL